MAWWNTIYYLTMCLGYRPFRLIYWAIGIILLFSIFYYKKMSLHINRYLSRDISQNKTSHRRHISRNLSTDSVSKYLNSIYFSTMLFVTFRLKKDLLIVFSQVEKRIIVTEWFIGFLVYIAFLTLSETGSILHTLKSLFIG